MVRSAKYLVDLNYDARDNKLRLIRALKHASLGGDDIITSKIKISISDPHTQQLFERMIEDNKGIVDRTFNPKLLVLNAKEFLDIVVRIYGKGSADGYQRTLNDIKAETKELNNELTEKNIFDEFKAAFKTTSLEKFVGACLNVLSKVVMK